MKPTTLAPRPGSADPAASSATTTPAALPAARSPTSTSPATGHFWPGGNPYASEAILGGTMSRQLGTG